MQAGDRAREATMHVRGVSEHAALDRRLVEIQQLLREILALLRERDRDETGRR